MIISVASGKGGTGKTTVAVNLAAQIARMNSNERRADTWLVDCDVEAPNAALFLNPHIETEIDVTRLLPVIDNQKCTGCGRCVEICFSNALARVNQRVVFFRELCHACGSCALNCPESAISEQPEKIGYIQRGDNCHMGFASGSLDVGFSSPVPVIRDLKKWIITTHQQQTFILDASPGCSCPVVETLRGSDFALLVSEPTPFGYHDLRLVLMLVQYGMRIPCGVVINKSSGRDAIIEDLCRQYCVPVLMRIPLSREIAESYARGELLIDAFPDYAQRFEDCFLSIKKLIAHNRSDKK